MSNTTDVVLPSTSTLIGSVSRLTYCMSNGPLIINDRYLSLYGILSWLTSRSEMRSTCDPLSTKANVWSPFHRAVTQSLSSGLSFYAAATSIMPAGRSW
jgi:hypothetical protein